MVLHKSGTFRALCMTCFIPKLSILFCNRDINSCSVRVSVGYSYDVACASSEGTERLGEHSVFVVLGRFYNLSGSETRLLKTRLGEGG